MQNEIGGKRAPKFGTQNVAFHPQTLNFLSHHYFRMQETPMNAKHNVLVFFILL